jgi:8-oxo-dGTP pyrophosphatase MutT (NUDIX family)
MTKAVHVLIVSARGELLMRSGADGVVSAFGRANEGGGAAVVWAVKALREEAGLDVRVEDLEFLDVYAEEDDEVRMFVLAGVDEDRVHAYGEDETLCKMRRSDDFETIKLSAVARKYVVDYFKRHKK